MKNRWVVILTLVMVVAGLCVWPAGRAWAHSALTAQSNPTLAGCPVFPGNNVWNTPVDTLPVHALSAQYISAIGAGNLHPDFGAGLYLGKHMGIPYNVVPGTTPKYSVTFTWPDESDAGPYPIPANPLIEEGSDAHLLVVDQSACKLYELYNVTPPANGKGWLAGSGAIFDLHSNALRPATFTSADAAGLPIVPGLVRYDEVASGHIDHALRFTVDNSKAGYLWPARHNAPYNPASNSPVMGLRLRLKASFNVASFPADVQVILNALKQYGMILADNGTSWYISGVPDDRWNNDNLHQLTTVPGANFEVVDESSLMVNVDSGQATFPALNVKVFIPSIKK
jgi:hypothetical protein